MREQASVARILKLERPALSLDFNSTSNGVGFEENKLDLFESNYFLQGYSAIEKQIANIEIRDEDDFALTIPSAKNLILSRERLVHFNSAKILSL